MNRREDEVRTAPKCRTCGGCGVVTRANGTLGWCQPCQGTGFEGGREP